MRAIRPFLRDLWALARPYWSSEDRWAARALLLVVVGLSLGLVYLDVLFNQWNNAFYNTLQGKDWPGFKHQLTYFCGLAVLFIVAAVYRLYFRQMLEIRWRRWLTDHFVSRWLEHRNYLRLQLTDRETDNPDQRIADDVKHFVEMTLRLTLELMSSVVTLFAFVAILWELSGPIELPLPGGGSLTVPGYMVWVAVVYAIIGTWLANVVGHPLIKVNYDQQRYEADFRFSLIRFRENAEAIALYRGEPDEQRNLAQRFANVAANWWALMKMTKRLTWYESGYSQIGIIFPFVVVSPRYFFSDKFQLGDLMQTASAFGQVRSSLSFFVTFYSSIAEWRSVVDRLIGFERAMQAAETAAREAPGVTLAEHDAPGFAARDVALRLPNGRVLADGIDLAIAPGERVLVTGPSGSGKSTLFRAFAGIWPFGAGTVFAPHGARVLFLPQRPYLPIGTLAEVLRYPDRGAGADDTVLAQALRDVGLGHLVAALGERAHWAQRLSGGEQQRIAVARALVLKPDWLFLDEATAAIDEKGEATLYTLLAERLPDATMVSIGHRHSLRRFHGRELHLDRDPASERPGQFLDRPIAVGA
ncbi:MAG: ABC transporter ATP-binding protein/permease [Alphaproteobacteria bacterium]|nr:ABC transporter ATP-binding protein/permease [Alphaproteobacteria bacterium]